ncbi:7TM diverse intracellular signaling domain-containing protein [Sediminitomix flava]|uniref:Serine phosphatase RsbU (Regulator of sigma subunit) n=1 Tax=Sediminitomix flava TaxID=379075 RepID=A0A315ZDW9_SEDFL|nr:7TM diverse intracellular signaling domain-containing protein [Sediminitomix flava]PWJ43765.1 serine phosphatase RsbU (regulator of sigma subunit) [Sediminitomix flava]
MKLFLLKTFTILQIIFFSGLSTFAQSSQYIQSKEGNNVIDLYWKDSQKPLGKDYKLSSGSTYEISSQLINTTENEEWVLLLESPNKKLYNPSYLEAVVRDSSNQVTYSTGYSGYYRSHKDRDIALLDKGVIIKLPQNVISNLTISIKNENGASLTPRFTISPKDKWLNEFKEYESSRNIFHGLVQGLLLFVALYNFILALFTRDKTYLYYALTAFFASIYFLYRSHLLHDYLITSNPTLIRFVWPTSVLAPLAHIMFIRYFVEMEKRMPLWDKVLKVVSAIGLATFIIEEAIMLFLKDEELVNLINTNAFIGLILVAIVTIFYILFSKNTLAYFLSFSTSWLLFGSLIAATTHNYDMIIYGFVIEMFILSLGLGYRQQQIQLERRLAQEELINQLQKNEELQEKVNKELADKVLERTMDIEQQKEEILAQSKHLEEANLEIAQQHSLLKQANVKITDSINYAKRIQSAMLPTQKQIQKIFNENVLFFRPKDIVSGDFYWTLEQDNKKFVAVVDCTGHGVPGALMSVIGYNLLSRIVKDRKITDPSEILYKMDEGIRDALKQEQTDVKDGMDMAICVIDEDHNELHFCGARNGLLYFKNNEIHELKGIRRSIGGYLGYNVHHFETSTVSLEKDMTFYMFSDGYQDQFGGDEKFKFTMKRFKKLLHENYQAPMDNQQFILKNTLEDWMDKGNEDQIDDILVLGFRL